MPPPKQAELLDAVREFTNSASSFITTVERDTKEIPTNLYPGDGGRQLLVLPTGRIIIECRFPGE